MQVTAIITFIAAAAATAVNAAAFDTIEACRASATTAVEECACFSDCVAEPLEDGGFHIYTNKTVSSSQMVGPQAVNSPQACRNPSTKFTVGDDIVNYGTWKPEDVLNNGLYNRCRDNACVPGEHVERTYVLDFQKRGAWRAVRVSASGFYPHKNVRTAMIRALKRMTKQGLIKDRVREINQCRPDRFNPCNRLGDWYDQYTYQNWYQIDMFNNCGHQAHMTAKVSVDGDEKGRRTCGTIFNLLSGAIGAINPIAGGVLGKFSVFCGA